MVLYFPQKKQWNELTTRRKASIVGMAIVQITLLVTALRDIRRRSAEEIKGSKRVWTALAFVNFVGPISYFIFGRKRS